MRRKHESLWANMSDWPYSVAGVILRNSGPPNKIWDIQWPLWSPLKLPEYPWQYPSPVRSRNWFPAWHPVCSESCASSDAYQRLPLHSWSGISLLLFKRKSRFMLLCWAYTDLTPWLMHVACTVASIVLVHWCVCSCTAKTLVVWVWGGLNFCKTYLLCHMKQTLACFVILMMVSFQDYLLKSVWSSPLLLLHELCMRLSSQS